MAPATAVRATASGLGGGWSTAGGASFAGGFGPGERATGRARHRGVLPFIGCESGKTGCLPYFPSTQFGPGSSRPGPECGRVEANVSTGCGRGSGALASGQDSPGARNPC